MSRTSKAKPKSRPKTTKSKKHQAPGTREGSKQTQLVEMLRQAKGATIAEIAEALSWQPHTVRGAIAGALKKTAPDRKIDSRSTAWKLFTDDYEHVALRNKNVFLGTAMSSVRLVGLWRKFHNGGYAHMDVSSI